MNPTEDLAFVAWMDEQIEQAGIAEQQELERYEAWAADRREDGYLPTERTMDAYADWLESLLPTD